MSLAVAPYAALISSRLIKHAIKPLARAQGLQDTHTRTHTTHTHYILHTLHTTHTHTNTTDRQTDTRAYTRPRPHTNAHTRAHARTLTRTHMHTHSHTEERLGGSARGLCDSDNTRPQHRKEGHVVGEDTEITIDTGDVHLLNIRLIVEGLHGTGMN